MSHSFGLIWRVIFCWLSKHSLSLFSVIVSLCSKIDTVCKVEKKPTITNVGVVRIGLLRPEQNFLSKVSAISG